MPPAGGGPTLVPDEAPSRGRLCGFADVASQRTRRLALQRRADLAPISGRFNRPLSRVRPPKHVACRPPAGCVPPAGEALGRHAHVADPPAGHALASQVVYLDTNLEELRCVITAVTATSSSGGDPRSLRRILLSSIPSSSNTRAIVLTGP